MEGGGRERFLSLSLLFDFEERAAKEVRIEKTKKTADLFSLSSFFFLLSHESVHLCSPLWRRCPAAQDNGSSSPAAPPRGRSRRWPRSRRRHSFRQCAPSTWPSLLLLSNPRRWRRRGPERWPPRVERSLRKAFPGAGRGARARELDLGPRGRRPSTTTERRPDDGRDASARSPAPRRAPPASSSSRAPRPRGRAPRLWLSRRGSGTAR